MAATRTRAGKAGANGNGASTGALYSKVQEFERSLKAPFVEKDTDAFLLTLAMLSRQHIAEIGGPGQAKTMLAERAVALIEGAQVFTLQFFKGTQPEEVFGAIDPQALMDGRWHRNVEGFFPTAHLAVLDEWWKTNSMILNGCLRIVNERKYKNNGSEVTCPLTTCIVASNELPEPGNAELAPIRDRFLITRLTQPVRTTQGRLEMLGGFLERQLTGMSNDPVMTLDELEQAQEQVKRIEVPTDVKGDLMRLWESAEREGISTSPRRFLQGVTVLQAKAYLAGRKEVLSDDLVTFQHMLWTDPDDAPTAHAVTLEFASEFEKAATRLRQEYEDVLPLVNQVREHLAADSVDFAAMTPVAAKAHSTLKGVMERTKDQIEKAGDANRDTRALDDLADAVNATREFIRQKALGMD